MTYLQRSIKFLAQLTENTIFQHELIKIYELTYKRQMIQQEEKLGDYGVGKTLPDKAYMELLKIDGELEKLLDANQPLIIIGYQNWLDRHQAYISDAAIIEEQYDYIRFNELPEWFSEASGKDVINRFGEQAILDVLTKNDWQAWIRKDQSLADTYDEHKEKLIKPMRRSEIVRDTILDDIRNNIDGLREEREERYQITPIRDVLQRVTDTWFGLSIGQKIVLFQEALTTAHNNGTMADYLIEGPGARALLTTLSAENNSYELKWDQDLTKLLGHPPGSTITPKDVWIQPASRRLARVIRCMAKQTVTPTEIPQADLIRIYELTYKYQMLKQEEKLGDYSTEKTLPDKAYMELNKIEEDLEQSLNATFDPIQRAYRQYIDYVPYVESKNVLLYQFEDKILDDLYWKLIDMPIKKMFDEFGEQRIRKALRNTAYYWQTKKLQSVQDVIDNFDDLTVKKRSTIIAGLCEDYVLRSYALKQVPLSELKEMYKRDSPEWRVYLMNNKLKNEWPSAALDKKIILFQEALTTAHQTGNMAYYLVQGRNPEALLRSLSSGQYTSKWKQDLTKLLGHPPGSTITPKDVWIQPASKRLNRVIQVLGIFYEC